jgi:Magnesium chelatase, subunit ChlI
VRTEFVKPSLCLLRRLAKLGPAEPGPTQPAGLGRGRNRSDHSGCRAVLDDHPSAILDKLEPHLGEPVHRSKGHRLSMNCPRSPKRVLEALRQSLEDVAWSADTASFFARFQLVAVVDPCLPGQVLRSPTRPRAGPAPEASGTRNQTWNQPVTLRTHATLWHGTDS